MVWLARCTYLLKNVSSSTYTRAGVRDSLSYTPHFHLKLIFPSEKLNSGHLLKKRKKRTFFQDKSAGNHNCDVAEEYDRSENIRNHSVNHELFTLFDHEIRNIRSHFTSASIEFICSDYVTCKVQRTHFLGNSNAPMPCAYL